MRPPRNIITRYEIRQIMPAAPGTFALFRREASGWVSRVPVVAWGVWDEVDEDFTDGRGTGRETARRLGQSEPLEVHCGRLCPCVAEDDFAGVRVGDFWNIDDDVSGFDSPARGSEPDKVEPETGSGDPGTAAIADPFLGVVGPEMRRRFWSLIDDGFAPHQLAVTIYETGHLAIDDPGPLVDVVLRERVSAMAFALGVEGGRPPTRRALRGAPRRPGPGARPALLPGRGRRTGAVQHRAPHRAGARRGRHHHPGRRRVGGGRVGPTAGEGRGIHARPERRCHVTPGERRAERRARREREAAIEQRRAEGRARWASEHDVQRLLPSEGWCASMRFWRRVFRLRGVAPRGREACQRWDMHFPQDHREVFVRGGEIVALVSMFYPGADREAEPVWRETAERFGLRFERDDSASWHMPSGMALFALWIAEVPRG